jgi:hypothetical protein
MPFEVALRIDSEPSQIRECPRRCTCRCYRKWLNMKGVRRMAVAISSQSGHASLRLDEARTPGSGQLTEI